jgi:hypothetical protein
MLVRAIQPCKVFMFPGDDQVRRTQTRSGNDSALFANSEATAVTAVRAECHRTCLPLVQSNQLVSSTGLHFLFVPRLSVFQGALATCSRLPDEIGPSDVQDFVRRRREVLGPEIEGRLAGLNGSTKVSQVR